MKQASWARQIEIWEEGIRLGQVASVQAQLSDLTLSRIPRPLAATVATLAFRAGMPFWSLRLLNPLIRPEKPLREKAAPEEVIAYSGALFRVGSYQEGFDLLETLSAERFPEVLLQKAFGYFRQWEYANGVPLLRKFLKLVSEDEYRHLVGRVNLTAGLIFFEKYEEAEALAVELLRETEAKSFMLLYGNTLELLAQIRIFQGHHHDADEILRLAQMKLASSPGQYSFFVKKWTVINRWLENHLDPNAAQGLSDLRQSSKQVGHWETCRDCDYYEALKTRDSILTTRLNFGTPFLGFRRRLKNEFGRIEQKTLLWRPSLGRPDLKRPDTQDIVSKEPLVLPTMPETLNRCLSALTKDFYRPIPLGELFSEVYPNEFFNPFSSPTRLETTVRRLRKLFETRELPLDIQVKNKTYRLVATGDCALEIQRQRRPLERPLLLLEKLKKHANQKSFDLQTAQTVLGVSKSTAQRVLHVGISGKRIAKMGYGRSRRFRFIK